MGQSSSSADQMINMGGKMSFVSGFSEAARVFRERVMKGFSFHQYTHCCCVQVKLALNCQQRGD
jgi:hypothetical protein